MKPLLFVIAFLSTSCCFAQIQRVYFLKNNGRYVEQRDSADYIRIVSIPDSGSDLYNLAEYYKDGKKKLFGKSAKIDPPWFEGQFLSFYPNGKKNSIISYKHNQPVGLIYKYYPNGKLYTVKNYPDNQSYYNDMTDNYLITACYDSTGVATVNNGRGYYREYSEDFSYVNEEGNVNDGKRTEVWKGNYKNIKVSFTENYSFGELTTGTATYGDGTTSAYTKVRSTPPQFKGGVEAFGSYLGRNIKYPDNDRRSETEGVVVLSFVVEKGGKITEVKVEKSVSPEIDGEAVRVLKASTKWVPGTRFGRPVRVIYQVPVSFNLTG